MKEDTKAFKKEMKDVVTEMKEDTKAFRTEIKEDLALQAGHIKQLSEKVVVAHTAAVIATFLAIASLAAVCSNFKP
jgi:Flp pilus assembly protein TadB